VEDFFVGGLAVVAELIRPKFGGESRGGWPMGEDKEINANSSRATACQSVTSNVCGPNGPNSGVKTDLLVQI